MKPHMRASMAASSAFKARSAIRTDVERFRHLLVSDTFAKLNDNGILHPNLSKGLDSNNFTYLTNL